jgi:S1-C subfamily serine protease
VAIDQGGRTTELPAKLMAEGTVPAQDLALLQIEGPKLMPAVLAGDDELAIGDQVLVVGAPFGNGLSISGGMLSQVRLARGEPEMLKTDAPVGYGASGGGMFSMETGHLVGIIEGYRTAEVQVPGNGSFSFDVPMPGETFAAPLAKVRRFLAEHQQSLGTAQVALRN